MARRMRHVYKGSLYESSNETHSFLAIYII